LTTTYNASATFTFNGTGVWVFGAKRFNHGQYNATLDGSIVSGNGYSSTQEFQLPLFNAVGLAPGIHEVTMTNAPVNTSSVQVYLDIDFVRQPQL
jgi:hypothetical protein